MTGLRFFVLSVGITLTAAACGTTAGGGGGIGQPFYPASGGQAGTACNPANQSEGCLVVAGGHARMKCDASSTWTAIGSCTANQLCLEQSDPNDPGKFKKVTACQDKPVEVDTAGATDAGGNGQDDTVGSLNDGGGVPPVDGGGNPPVDGGPIPPVDGGGDPVGEWLACAQSKCGSQWAACAADEACKFAAACVDKCGGNKTCEQSCVTSAGTSGAQLASLMYCAVEVECVAGVGPKCGNGACEAGETPSNCATDCKSSGPVCGNGQCEPGETPSTCAQDCKSSGPVCGNGKCEAGETASTCAKDCGLPSPVCGDGKCEGSENASNCNKDCGTPAKCGDGKCDVGETAVNCAVDCGGGGANSCVGKCGDYKEGAACQCDSGCAEYGDCCADFSKVCGGGSTPKCGDGNCDAGESASTCPADCGGSSTGLTVCLKSKCASEYNACKSSSGCNGILLYIAAGDCAEANKCGSDSNCVQTKCANELNACQSNTACSALLGCLGNCKQGDQNCQGQCLAPGGSQYQTMGMCAQSKCQ